MAQAAAADRGEEVLDGLHVLICAHRKFLHLSRTGSRRVAAGGTSGGQRLSDIRVRLEMDSQKDGVRLDRFPECFGDDRG